MIKTKNDLKRYLDEDRKAYGKKEHFTLKEKIVGKLFPDNNWEYTKCLRKLEYYTNNNNMLRRFWQARKLGKLKRKTGIHLEPNVAGPGIYIVHGSVIISSIAKLGENCKVQQYVTIGGTSRYNNSGAPTIGNRVFIGAGAAVIGNIKIADDVVIGANAVVAKDILEPGITVAGAPARKISDQNSYHYLNRE